MKSYNPKYLEYCLQNGNTPEEQWEKDGDAVNYFKWLKENDNKQNKKTKESE